MTGASTPIHVQYYALLREERGLSTEEILTSAASLRQLYEELRQRHGFTLPVERMQVAVNDAFASWDAAPQANDRVVFIPPVAGG